MKAKKAHKKSALRALSLVHQPFVRRRLHILLKCPNRWPFVSIHTQIQHSSIIHLLIHAVTYSLTHTLILALLDSFVGHCVETFNYAHLNWCMSFRYDLVNYRKFMISTFRLNTIYAWCDFYFIFGLNLGVSLFPDSVCLLQFKNKFRHSFLCW